MFCDYFLWLAHTGSDRVKYVEIGDISDESAVKYLTYRKISEKIATVAVNKLTGGRFRQLIAVQRKLVDVKDEKKSLEIIDGKFLV